ncbi:MAG: hypothetical protein ACYDH9_08420 [Limisphaerales bacterium]
MKSLFFVGVLSAAFVLALTCPTGAADTPDLRPGLLVRATDGQRAAVFIAPTPDFTLTESQSIHPQLRPQFKAEWDGVLKVLRGGEYTLSADARVVVNGKEVANRPVLLEAGDLPLHLEYARPPRGPARLQLLWESGFFKQEPIPSSAFAHRETPPELARCARITRGRELVEDLNCVACHKTGSSLLPGRVGPVLTAIGSRTTARWIFKWLENPRHFRRTAVMPVVLEIIQDRADVAAYLAGLKDSKDAVKETASDETRIARGKQLFDTVGCTACHTDTDNPLAGLGSKISAARLARYLRAPLAGDPSGRMPEMNLNAEEAGAIAEHLVQSRNPEFEAAVPPGDADRGRHLVATSGCLNCHTLNDAGVPVPTALTAPEFNRLSGGKGCLAENPSRATPRYALSADDRASLEAFLGSPDISEAPVPDFYRRVSQFRCDACHELNGPAKVAFDKLPPPLTDAGNKLRASWLDQVLNHRKRVRPWMELRMPHYGAVVQPLVAEFAGQAGAEPGEGATIPPPPPEQIQAGAKLVGRGEGGLSCINCHDFRGEKSGGEMRGPDMTEMYARVRVDWARRWWRDPARIIPGTAMPSFFSEMPSPQAERMMSDLLAALSLGKNMPIPEGFHETGAQYLLLVTNAPVVFRTFMNDSSPRSIAVGLPGRQSYCFDAEHCSLRYAWAGDFLDVKPVWAERGGAPANILGKKYFIAPPLCPVRIGDPGREPKVQFRGYQLVHEFPQFLFEVDGVTVHETITAAQRGNGLVYAFEIGPVNQAVWFLAGDQPGVTITSSTGEFTRGQLRIPGTPGATVRFDVTIVAK